MNSHIHTFQPYFQSSKVATEQTFDVRNRQTYKQSGAASRQSQEKVVLTMSCSKAIEVKNYRKLDQLLRNVPFSQPTSPARTSGVEPLDIQKPKRP